MVSIWSRQFSHRSNFRVYLPAAGRGVGMIHIRSLIFAFWNLRIYYPNEKTEGRRVYTRPSQAIWTKGSNRLAGSSGAFEPGLALGVKLLHRGAT